MCNIKDLPELSVDNSGRETELKPLQNWTLRSNRLQALRLTNVSDSTSDRYCLVTKRLSSPRIAFFRGGLASPMSQKRSLDGVPNEAEERSR